MQATLDSLKATSKKSAWRDLAAHYKKLRGTHLRQLFKKDPKRGERHLRRAVDARDSGQTGGALRARRLHPRSDLGH